MSTIVSYDMKMKRAHLVGLQIPGTALLVDECQDMDACQVDWVANQRGKPIYFVGDAARTIYSFRGAKSRFMMNLNHPVTDCTLTKSWRFDPNIAQIANLVLFPKEHSPQTTGNRSGYETWKPYRLKSGGKTPGTVKSEPLLPMGKIQPVTLLAFSNAKFLTAAVSITGYGKQNDQEYEFDLEDFPECHINGKGENSGIRMCKQILKAVATL